MSSVSYRCPSCGTEHAIEGIRHNLYLGQRTIGDYQAARRGLAVLSERLVRGQGIRQLMRGLRGD